MARIDAIILICWIGSLFPYFEALDPDTASASFPSKAWHGPGVGMCRSELFYKFFQQFLKVQEETFRVFVGIR